MDEPFDLLPQRGVDVYSVEKYGKEFLHIKDAQKMETVEFMSKSWKVRPFFQRFRYLLIGGYFTSDIGFSVIGYSGNVPLTEYPGVPDDLIDLVEEELWRLGL